MMCQLLDKGMNMLDTEASSGSILGCSMLHARVIKSVTRSVHDAIALWMQVFAKSPPPPPASERGRSLPVSTPAVVAEQV